MKPQKSPCFYEAYKDCNDTGKLLEYENYQWLNRSMGTVFSFYWFAVAIFFNFVFYPHGDNHLIYEMEEYHSLYMYSWYWFVSSHVLIYFPFTYIWF